MHYNSFMHLPMCCIRGSSRDEKQYGLLRKKEKILISNLQVNSISVLHCCILATRIMVVLDLPVQHTAYSEQDLWKKSEKKKYISSSRRLYSFTITIIILKIHKQRADDFHVLIYEDSITCCM